MIISVTSMTILIITIDMTEQTTEVTFCISLDRADEQKNVSEIRNKKERTILNEITQYLTM